MILLTTFSLYFFFFLFLLLLPYAKKQGQSHFHHRSQNSSTSTSSSSCVGSIAGGSSHPPHHPKPRHHHCRYSTSFDDDANEPLLCDETVCSAFVTSASLITAITAESPSSRQASSTCSAASELEFGSVAETGEANPTTGAPGLGSRPPRLHRRLFPSSSSSSQVSDA